jgi:macrolide transport system ATP-binding/permease protein
MWSWRRRRPDEDFAQEIRAHVAHETDRLVAEGASPVEARTAALRAFGNVTKARERFYEARRTRWLTDTAQDIRYAIRVLRRDRLFALTAAVSLAVGVAGNAAIFSLVDALFLRPIPKIVEPERLVEVGRTFRTQRFGNLSYPNYLDYRDRNTVFEDLAAYRLTSAAFGLGTGAVAERVDGSRVSGNYFAVLGVQMAIGRGFALEDERPGAQPVAVITDRLWRAHFNADPTVIGRTIQLNGQPVSIVGVAPAGFIGHTVAGTDLWVPLAFSNDAGVAGNSRAGVWLLTIGRLKPGVSIEQARSEMARIARDLEREYPQANAGHGVALAPWRTVPAQLAGLAGGFLAALFALVGTILLIACTNVGGIMLARGMTRGREIAMRLALGATRGRVIRLLLVESTLVGTLGSVIGVVLARAVIDLLRTLTPALPMPVVVDFRLDWRVVAFAIGLSVIAGVACGLIPALEATRPDLAVAAKLDGQPRGVRRLWVRQAFLVAQLALSVVLVVAAMLLGRSLLNAKYLNPGFDTEHLEVATLNLQLAGYIEQRGAVFVNDLLERLALVPSIESACASMVVPLTTEAIGLGPVRTTGTASDERDALFPEWNAVSPRYFETLKMPLVRGRGFTPADRAGMPRVMVVNETLAKRLWPDQNAIGQIVVHRTGGSGSQGDDLAWQVIGVARDAKYRWLGEEPTPAAYVPFAQNYWSGLSVIVRTSGQTALPTIREVIRKMDPNLPIVQSGTFAERTAFALFPYRAAAWVSASAGIIGLLLAAIGIYGVTAFNATRRTREIGIRVALGARRRQVVGQILRGSVRVAFVGGVIGLMTAAAIAQLLGHLLLSVRPLDPLSFIAAVVLLLGLTIIASLIPARRAASVDPLTALRTE